MRSGGCGAATPCCVEAVCDMVHFSHPDALCCAVLCQFLQGKRSLFLGAVGAGARMKLVVNMTMGSMMGEGALLGYGGGGEELAVVHGLWGG